MKNHTIFKADKQEGDTGVLCILRYERSGRDIEIDGKAKQAFIQEKVFFLVAHEGFVLFLH